MDFDDPEEQEEEMGIPPSYDSLANSSSRGAGGPVAAPPPPKLDAAGSGARKAAASGGGGGGGGRYRECLKNHAVGIGGHAVDGCGEFMAAGEEGTLDALKCAACNCHRNFHRKESAEGDPSAAAAVGVGFHPHHLPHQPHFASPYYRTPGGYLHVAPHHHRPLALPSTSGGGGGGGGGGSHSREEQEDMSNPSGSGGGGSSKKRFRTKFTQEQKDKMLAFAERVGWRIQKHDEAAVQQFCNETCVKRHVLKVWMHNNKHTLGKKP
ncbi:ZF-HD homeobox protein [Acorus calamus]|uniref:ZF-HD homeobox protein n=1 Tax=Acorus calamus TaxID=4465 RepID=A0AAV9CD00_ACOCL|nr:ZF-HD homeobox protein [Acorus calamus]